MKDLSLKPESSETLARKHSYHFAIAFDANAYCGHPPETTTVNHILLPTSYFFFFLHDVST
jgi:hypothetical protein